MELYKELLIEAFKSNEAQVFFPELHIDATEIVRLECYRALNQIKNIIANDALSDRECFMRIEQIVCLLEDIGSDGGERHDFG